MKFKKNDQVLVTAGKDKGKKGKILKVFPKAEEVLVEGVNLFVKHIKKQGKAAGEKIRKERPLPTANVAIWNEEAKKADRVAFMTDKEGNKIRIFRKTGKAI
jgi:large subunit ribosomal protein L24